MTDVSMKSTKTGVFIHGCHLQANLNGQNWEKIIWGSADPNNAPTFEGRAVMGIFTAIAYEADVVLFSTGASERDGIKESHYTLDFLLQRTHLLESFFKGQGYDISSETIKTYLEKAILDQQSQNTHDECKRNLHLCVQLGIDRVILISSPWHIQRSHTEALKALQEMREEGSPIPREVLAKASYGSTEDVVIIEPPHRGDRPVTHFNTLASGFFKVKPDSIPEFEAELTQLLKKFG